MVETIALLLTEILTNLDSLLDGKVIWRSTRIALALFYAIQNNESAGCLPGC